MHANLCMHILASTFQDGGNPFPVTRFPVLNSVTDSSRHTLLLLYPRWSRQVYIIHRSITGFLVVQENKCTHAHGYRPLVKQYLQWNLNLTKCQGTGKIGSLSRVFIISRFVFHIFYCVVISLA